MIFEYCKVLWDPHQLKCQNQIYDPNNVRLTDLYFLSSTHLISKFADATINLWNLKEKRIEKCLEPNFLATSFNSHFSPPHTMFFLYKR